MRKYLCSMLISILFLSCNSNSKKIDNEFSNLEIDRTKISKYAFEYLDEFSINPPENWERLETKYENKKVVIYQSAATKMNYNLQTLDLFNKRSNNSLMSISLIKPDSAGQNIYNNYVDFIKMKFRNNQIKMENFVHQSRDIKVIEIRKQNLMSLRFLFLSSGFNIFQIEFTFNPENADEEIEFLKSSIASIKFNNWS